MNKLGSRVLYAVGMILCDATIELLETVFYMLSLPRCYKQDKSGVYLVARETLASKEATALKAVTRQRLVKTQQTENTYCVLY
jgi:hypothetical protein